MKQELIDMLLEYYGELVQERGSTGSHDWPKRDDVIRRMDAIDTLLGYSSNQETTMQTIINIVKSKQ